MRALLRAADDRPISPVAMGLTLGFAALISTLLSRGFDIVATGSVGEGLARVAELTPWVRLPIGTFLNYAPLLLAGVYLLLPRVSWSPRATVLAALAGAVGAGVATLVWISFPASGQPEWARDTVDSLRFGLIALFGALALRPELRDRGQAPDAVRIGVFVGSVTGLTLLSGVALGMRRVLITPDVAWSMFVPNSAILYSVLACGVLIGLRPMIDLAWRDLVRIVVYIAAAGYVIDVAFGYVERVYGQADLAFHLVRRSLLFALLGIALALGLRARSRSVCGRAQRSMDLPCPRAGRP